jgi:hypothetical protein
MDAPCGNCGRPSDDLAAVHRVYLVPERVRLDEAEWWCASCRSQYPHEEVKEGKGKPGSDRP